MSLRRLFDKEINLLVHYIYRILHARIYLHVATILLGGSHAAEIIHSVEKPIIFRLFCLGMILSFSMLGVRRHQIVVVNAGIDVRIVLPILKLTPRPRKMELIRRHPLLHGRALVGLVAIIPAIANPTTTHCHSLLIIPARPPIPISRVHPLITRNRLARGFFQVEEFFVIENHLVILLVYTLELIQGVVDALGNQYTRQHLIILPLTPISGRQHAAVLAFDIDGLNRQISRGILAFGPLGA